jgi:hypothetical protein
MHVVSLPIEILRTKPALAFWLAALAQALIWVLVPTLFYAAPPGELAETLARARHVERLALIAPPLAYFLAETAMRMAGLFGVYLLSQICVVVTLWAVFSLGRATLGARHAALATLLTACIYFFTMPTPDFSPAILAMPLWALALLHFWRAAGEDRELYWLALAADLALLLLTTYLAGFLIALLAAFAILSAHVRSRLTSASALAVMAIVPVMLLVHWVWLRSNFGAALPALPNLRSADLIEKNLRDLARLLGILLAGHAGIAIMVAIATGVLRRPRDEAAVIERAPASDLASAFILYFALVPPLLLVAAAVLAGYSGPVAFGPVVVLSGLAAVLAAGDAIAIRRQRAAALAWLFLLLAPPVITVMTALLLPWTAAADPRAGWPAREMGRFFTENFERRTGARLEFVTGDPALAALVAVGSASRPFVFDIGTPDEAQLPTQEQLFEKGGIVVWRATDSAGTPPIGIRTRFPDLVPEVPRVFERRVEGRLPQLRLGWAMIRPKAQTLPQTEAAPAR